MEHLEAEWSAPQGQPAARRVEHCPFRHLGPGPEGFVGLDTWPVQARYFDDARAGCPTEPLKKCMTGESLARTSAGGPTGLLRAQSVPLYRF
jgi:hypothetical protein